MAAGLFAGLQLSVWQLNLGLEWLTFGRLRPLHTNAAIFAFVGNMMFCGIYYSTQRLCRTRLASPLLTKIHFWGWQLIIVAAAITLPLGFTRGKEYAELIWPINIAVAGIWVVFAANFFWTLARRNEKSIYVAIWFYIATIVTVAMLYIVNHLSIPTGWLHSYPIFGGFKDGLVQWWYGHNAVAFFLTTPILGIMYYFVPKSVNRPVYSYRLSVIHFWSLVFIYIWAGPHHLLNTALPNWLQSLGMIFSLMLWAPSWGGMLNGLFTLRGAWDKLRTDPVVKFFAAGVTFYGMSTFEGPLMSIKAVNALSHYSDWTIGHVHGGTLGWNGFMAAGMFYWLAPRLWGTKLYSTSMANIHFWLGLVGILLYVASMWIAGIGQGLMLNGTTEGGTLLSYPTFMETLVAIKPMMATRIVGGAMYLIGFLMLAYNIFRTIRGGSPVNGTVDVPAAVVEERASERGFNTFLNAPIIYTTLILVFASMALFGNGFWFIVGLLATIATTLTAVVHFEVGGRKWSEWYDKLLEHSLGFSVLTLIAVAIGGAVQIIPSVLSVNASSLEDRLQVLYTPLELAGRDIYVSEGCYNCHSQISAPLSARRARATAITPAWGESGSRLSLPCGSKRKGRKPRPTWRASTQRCGTTDHMLDPRQVSGPRSLIAGYPWLFEKTPRCEALGPARSSVANATWALPYPLGHCREREIRLPFRQAEAGDRGRLEAGGRYVDRDKEIVA
jgi:cytochrome c oxidase cbb3-type subunit I/II